MTHSTRIMFLRNEHNHPIGCLSISVDRKTRKVNYQLSVLNPVDDFNRPLARQLALGRLLEKPISIALPRNDVNMHVISRAVMMHLANSNAPSRAVKAARLWLKNVITGATD